MADSKPTAYIAPAVQALVASTTDRVRPNAKLIALLSLGHFVVDLNQGSLPAVLPFLKTGTASGLIVGFAIGAGGLGVTALGWVADRHGLPAALWISALMPLAAFVVTRFLPAPSVHDAR
jgi:FSR family fosmidomycin resistance protein-like MFS transporter